MLLFDDDGDTLYIEDLRARPNALDPYPDHRSLFAADGV